MIYIRIIAFGEEAVEGERKFVCLAGPPRVVVVFGGYMYVAHAVFPRSRSFFSPMGRRVGKKRVEWFGDSDEHRCRSAPDCHGYVCTWDEKGKQHLAHGKWEHQGPEGSQLRKERIRVGKKK